tara:strand:+ start:2406 stop:2990 length:585 start_codon:yes stop_codon:yes gene_type:complete
MENNMKMYKLKGKIYQEPVSKDFDYKNSIEILSPILEDGTIILSHPKAKDLPKKEDGNFYSKYNEDLTANIEYEKELLVESLSKKIKTHFGNLINEGFEYKDYWITSKQSQQDDLHKRISGVEMLGLESGEYKCYKYIDNKRRADKEIFSFSLEELKNIYKTGSVFIGTTLSAEEDMLISIRKLSIKKLENFKI